MSPYPSWLEQPSRSSYLLKAESDEMERWRAAADAEGMTFAAYARKSLNVATTVTPVPGTPSVLMVVSRSCYSGAHKACHASGCECECH